MCRPPHPAEQFDVIASICVLYTSTYSGRIIRYLRVKSQWALLGLNLKYIFITYIEMKNLKTLDVKIILEI